MAKQDKEKRTGRPEHAGRPDNPGGGGRRNRPFSSRPGSAEFHDEKAEMHREELAKIDAEIEKLEMEQTETDDPERLTEISESLDHLNDQRAEVERSITEHMEAAARKRAGEDDEVEPVEEEPPVVEEPPAEPEV